MNTITINILPENFIPLPINFHTASERFQQMSMDRPKGTQDFYQILIVLDGKGTLEFDSRIYKLKKGCAFFTAENVCSKYTDDGNLITAFLTAKGDGIPQLLKHFECKDFLFCKSVNTEKYVSDIKNIIKEYYKYKREGVLSSMTYSFFVDFFGQFQENNLTSLDKTALYIEKNFTKKLTLAELAEINETSVSKLCHDFKDKFGCTVFQQILNLRLTYAQNLLVTRANTKTKDAAIACGFDDISYFCRAYKNKFGKSPSET